MRQWAAVALLAGITATLGQGQDVVYRKSRILGDRQRVELTFSEQDHSLLLRKKGTVIERIPFDTIDEVSFRDVKRRRWREAGDVLSLNRATGVLIIFTVPITVVIAVPMMFTKETKHQLTVEFREAGAPRSIALQLDKSEYDQVLATIRTQTGKRVEMPEAVRKP